MISYHYKTGIMERSRCDRDVPHRRYGDGDIQDASIDRILVISMSIYSRDHACSVLCWIYVFCCRELYRPCVADIRVPIRELPQEDIHNHHCARYLYQLLHASLYLGYALCDHRLRTSHILKKYDTLQTKRYILFDESDAGISSRGCCHMDR